MAQGGSPNVDRVAPKGPQVTHVPDTSPYPPPAGSPRSQFEAVSPVAVRGGKKAGMSAHSGAPDKGSGGPGLGSVASMRGHRDMAAQFAAASGRSPKRGPGKKTPTDEATKRKLSTAGS
jgi:hypothetical protein